MPIKTAFKTEIQHVSILDEAGNFDAKLGEGLIPDDDLLKLYRHMVLCRNLDEVAFKLQRSGRMGTYPQNMGQEATSLGAAYVLRKTDWLVTCYRENAGLFWRGLPMEYILWHWMGDERGNQIPQGLHVTPISIPIGTQMLHATGLAWSNKYRGEDDIACTFFGDGATSEGDFHEAANFAANLDIPVIFFCQNNGWAISVPTKIQCSAPTIAQRGLAYGMDCIQCDGNDIFAVVKVMKDAAERARKNKRPTFIEALTYRLGDHTTADDARRYRDANELESWKNRDPITRLGQFLRRKKLWDDKKEAAAQEQAKTEVSAVVERAEGIAAPAKTEFFDSMYAKLPENLVVQRDTMRTHSLGQDPSQLGEGVQSSQHHDVEA
ncbi:MAG TPA: pyruvate dehydrogenase (acetyl-transferring) E1 component subunit alpha [Phycisphaerales bacterium]|nr:pyruvate dehydrogenase (acetyl-transferring) E1 component subunit alpha [Phycisphaerales bacterium]